MANSVHAFFIFNNVGYLRLKIVKNKNCRVLGNVLNKYIRNLKMLNFFKKNKKLRENLRFLVKRVCAIEVYIQNKVFRKESTFSVGCVHDFENSQF